MCAVAREWEKKVPTTHQPKRNREQTKITSLSTKYTSNGDKSINVWVFNMHQNLYFLVALFVFFLGSSYRHAYERAAGNGSMEKLWAWGKINNESVGAMSAWKLLQYLCMCFSFRKRKKRMGASEGDRKKYLQRYFKRASKRSFPTEWNYTCMQIKLHQVWWEREKKEITRAPKTPTKNSSWQPLKVRYVWTNFIN